MDDLATVYYSQETNEVVGSLLKGVTEFCKTLSATMPGFRIEIQDGRVQLGHILRARLWGSASAPQDLATLTIQKLIQVAEAAEVETEVCFA